MRRLRLFSFSSCSDSDYCCPDYCLFCCSPAYAFSGRPPGGAGCRERSQRSCLRPGGLPSLTRNPGLAATVPVAPPLSRRGLRSRHPGKRPPGWDGNAVSQTALHVVAAGSCPLLCQCHSPVYFLLSPGADAATTCRTDCRGK